MRLRSSIRLSQMNPRAAKQRADLLSSFDTISSHLETTFTALSTALARGVNRTNSASAQAHLAVLVGPSITSAKSKVIRGIDGLELKIWGTLDPAVPKQDDDSQSDDDGEEADDNHGDSEDSAEVPEDSDEEVEDSEEGEGSEFDDDDEEEEEEDEEEQAESDRRSSSPPAHVSFAEQQRLLQAAERILSRTLAVADASGNGMASEMCKAVLLPGYEGC